MPLVGFGVFVFFNVCVCGWFLFILSSYYSVNTDDLFGCGVCLSICVCPKAFCMCVYFCGGSKFEVLLKAAFSYSH